MNTFIKVVVCVRRVYSLYARGSDCAFEIYGERIESCYCNQYLYCRGFRMVFCVSKICIAYSVYCEVIQQKKCTI